MKLPALQQAYLGRRSNSFRFQPDSTAADGSAKSTTAVFWLFLHCLCCLISLVLGFRFSRLVFFLLLSTTTTTTPFFTNTPMFHRSSDVSDVNLPVLHPPTPKFESSANRTKIIVGRHGILIRPWPHPNPVEVMKAHKIMETVQREQRLQYGVKNSRSLIVVTPTYVRTFQALHLTGLMHTLMNVPYDLVWIVVEAGGVSNETAALLAKSGLNVKHVGFEEKMPVFWEARHKMETRMRLHALRMVRDEKLDGIVMFADDSNMHSMELFDEIQKVRWFGAVSVGILAHSGHTDEELVEVQKNVGGESKSSLPVQGPACNSSDQLVGWHTFNSKPFVDKNANYIGDRGVVLPRKLEWAGFVLTSRLVWGEGKPEWVKDLDMVTGNGEDIESPLSLLKDSSMVEPLGSCGRKVMMWWLRAEARADSKFPSGWTIDPPLEVTVPAKRTPWPDAPLELPSIEKVIPPPQNVEKRTRPRVSRSKRSSRGKRKHEARNVDARVSVGHSGEK